MIKSTLGIPDVILIKPKIFSDARGYFFESFNATTFAQLIGREISFVQDNRSFSKQAVLRGLHYQKTQPQGKLVSVLQGCVFDVAVDLRPHSSTYGQWVGEILSAENQHQLWIPEGCAHGFVVLSEGAEFYYKVTDYWNAQDERCLRFDDPTLNIQWPHVINAQGETLSLILSDKDRAGHDFIK